MPRGDRTGPIGIGAMSGRAAGFCAGFNMAGYAHPTAAGGAGMRLGRRGGGWSGPAGGGRRWRCRSLAFGRMGAMYGAGYAAVPHALSSEMEKELLRNRSQVLQSELEAVNKRLEEIAQPESAT